jgi:putative transposase
MRQSKAWRAAKAMPRHTSQSTDKAKNKDRLTAENKAKAKAFKVVREKFAFTSGSIQKYGEECRNACGIGDHLGSHDTQTTTLRAFRAVEQYAFGERGRPCWKRFNQLESIEGKEQAVIRYKADPIPALHYSGLVIALMLDPKDKDQWQQEALACRVKYTRILRRERRGKTRWYTQLVMEGLPPTKGRVTGQGVVGLDIGPSTIASFHWSRQASSLFARPSPNPGKKFAESSEPWTGPPAPLTRSTLMRTGP